MTPDHLIFKSSKKKLTTGHNNKGGVLSLRMAHWAMKLMPAKAKPWPKMKF
jgi:hypothetical protein